MPETFMKQVLCPMCPDADGEGATEGKVEMRFNQHRGPYDSWYDETKKRTITKAMAHSRCVREFWICPKCMTVSWFDFLIDLKMDDLPPEIREWMKTRWHVEGAVGGGPGQIIRP